MYTHYRPVGAILTETTDSLTISTTSVASKYNLADYVTFTTVRFHFHGIILRSETQRCNFDSWGLTIW